MFKNTQKITPHGQAGFITGMQGWLNVPNSMNITCLINGLKVKNHMKISIDGE